MLPPENVPLFSKPHFTPSSNTISNRAGLNKYNVSDYYHKSSLANNSEKNSTTDTKEKVQEENNRKLQEAAERAIKSIEQGNT